MPIIKLLSVKPGLKNERFILKIKRFNEVFFLKNKMTSSVRNPVSSFLSTMFIILRRLYAMNINPASALALLIPFFVMT